MEPAAIAHELVGGELMSAGGTGTYDINIWATEIQAGSYALMDTAYAKLGLPFGAGAVRVGHGDFSVKGVGRRRLWSQGARDGSWGPIDCGGRRTFLLRRARGLRAQLNRFELAIRSE